MAHAGRPLARRTSWTSTRCPGSTSRAARSSGRPAPTRPKSEESLRQVAESLRRLDVSYLVTIGGNDTAFASARIAAALAGRLAVAHVPKTIDNDLPLPEDVPTFGFTTAVNLGKDLVRNLMQDAATTQKWFFVTVMGRHAGHLTLGIGGAAGATLMLIGEEFAGERVPIGHVADILEGAIIKRRAHGREHGVALLAEGILEKLDPDTMGRCRTTPTGTCGSPTSSWPGASRTRCRRAWPPAGSTIGIAAKDLGYELRCAPPGGFDIQYARSLGYSAARFLLDGGTEAMVTIQGGRLVPVPVPRPARSPDGPRATPLRRRLVRGLPDALRLHDPAQARGLRAPGAAAALVAASGLSEADFVARFGYLVGAAPARAASALRRAARP